MMNIAFSKLLKIGDRQREFNFRKLPGTGESFYVDVTDETGKRIMFHMYKDPKENWQAVAPELPSWISSAETVLGAAIDNEMSVTDEKRP